MKKKSGFTPTPIYIAVEQVNPHTNILVCRVKTEDKRFCRQILNSLTIRKLVRGFTLVEILVVITIIAVLLSLIMSVLARSRQAAYRLTCLNNLKQLGVAVTTYAQSYDFYPVCVPPDVNEKWSDFLADKTIAAGKELGVPVSLWPFHQTATLYNCPILNKAGCDISYCYNYLAGKRFAADEPVVEPSYIPPTPPPAKQKADVRLLAPEKVKSPGIFILLYDLPIKSNIIIGPDSNVLNDLYHDIDPDDYRKVETFAPGVDKGYLGYAGPHVKGHSILFGDGHVKWYKGWSDSSMSRGPQ